MTAFSMAFVFIMLFTIGVGIAALIFTSFDAETSRSSTRKTAPTQRLYDIVRRINTETIETVDNGGTVQRWTRSTQ